MLRKTKYITYVLANFVRITDNTRAQISQEHIAFRSSKEIHLLDIKGNFFTKKCQGNL